MEKTIRYLKDNVLYWNSIIDERPATSATDVVLIHAQVMLESTEKLLKKKSLLEINYEMLDELKKYFAKEKERGFDAKRRILIDECVDEIKECFEKKPEPKGESINSVQQKIGWISIKEQLPKNKQLVLVYCGCDSSHPSIRHDQVALFEDQFLNKSFQVMVGTQHTTHYATITDKVTHWMELPEKPKN